MPTIIAVATHKGGTGKTVMYKMKAAEFAQSLHHFHQFDKTEFEVQRVLLGEIGVKTLNSRTSTVDDIFGNLAEQREQWKRAHMHVAATIQSRATLPPRTRISHDVSNVSTQARTISFRSTRPRPSESCCKLRAVRISTTHLASQRATGFCDSIERNLMARSNEIHVYAIWRGAISNASIS